MTTTTPSAALVRVAPVFTNTERLALAGFLAAYSGLTRQAYELDLRQFAGWCQRHQVRLFQARPADIEFFARDLEACGRARATITRRLCTVAGFYRYAVEEETARSLTRRACPPAPPGLRVPRHRTGPQRTRRTPGRRRARAAGGARPDLPARPQRAARLRGCERGHRGARHTARAQHPGDHPQGRQGRHHPARATHRPGNRPGDRRAQRRTLPIFLAADGRRLDRHGAGRIVRRIARRAGITKKVGPHSLRHASITAALDAGVPLRDVQEAASHADPRTTMRCDRARTSLDRHATYIVAAYVAGAAR